MHKQINLRSKPIAELKLEKYITLTKNWNYSVERLKHISKELEAIDNKNISIVVAGSYGRLEASPSSDLDFMVICQNDPEKYQSVVTEITSIIKGTEIELPNAEGVFSKVISIDQSIENIGHFDDSLQSLAQRMLLLLETQPIYNETLYYNACDEILRRYMDFVIQEPEKEALFFINDLIRYFRSICVNYQYNFWRQKEKWTLRNVKLRHSRVLMYAGTLLLIMNSSKQKDKFTYIKSKLNLTPLERIAHVYCDNQDQGMNRILSSYEVFLRMISDTEIRQGLVNDYEHRYDNPHYIELKVSSELIRSSLTNFILDKKGVWSSGIFEYMIF